VSVNERIITNALVSFLKIEGEKPAMTKILLERDSMTITWENMNAYVPEERKSLFSCLKKKTETVERRHIIQNGMLLKLF
jgi:hypothetical protein